MGFTSAEKSKAVMQTWGWGGLSVTPRRGGSRDSTRPVSTYFSVSADCLIESMVSTSENRPDRCPEVEL